MSSSYWLPPPSDENGTKSSDGIVIAYLLPLFMFAAIIPFFWVKRCRDKLTKTGAKGRSTKASPSEDGRTVEKFLQALAKEKPVRFKPEELSGFTNNYCTKLGSGGFATVYKGEFPNGVKMAVKVLKKSLDKRAEAQFMAEVGTIGRTFHINLVRLYGFCYERNLTALVYEYMENGSLDRYLFDETKRIQWQQLHNIAIETARGIAYLHEQCQQRIIHYDIKPANILLDGNFTAKVADFGLATLCSRDATHDSLSGYKGTPGYSAPELLLRNHGISHKCDVYSFGMLLLEIVGRRRNASIGKNDPSESLDWFPKHVWDHHTRCQLPILIEAQGIDLEYRSKAERMCMVALWCVQDSPTRRPSMSEVLRMLEGGEEIEHPPKPFGYLSSPGIARPMSADRMTRNGSSTKITEADSSERIN